METGSPEVLARHSSEGDSSGAFAHMIHRNLRFHLTAPIAAFFAFCLATAPAIAAPINNIVLVHGAWADGSGWNGVYNILTNSATLFAGGYAACFENAILHVSRNAGLKFADEESK